MTHSNSTICSLKSTRQRPKRCKIVVKNTLESAFKLVLPKQSQKMQIWRPQSTKNGKHSLKSWLAAPPRVAIHLELKCPDLKCFVCDRGSKASPRWLVAGCQRRNVKGHSDCSPIHHCSSLSSERSSMIRSLGSFGSASRPGCGTVSHHRGLKDFEFQTGNSLITLQKWSCEVWS